MSTVDPNSIPWRVPTWFPDLRSEVISKLREYQLELVKFNRTINLISAKSILTSDQTHIADAVLAFKAIESGIKGKEVYDLGSGNGIPGIIFAILSPETKFVLVDSDQRKSEFLKHIASHLGLSNVTIRNVKIESLEQGCIDIAVARGFAPLTAALLTTRRPFKRGGRFFHLKGDEWGLELTQIPSQVCGFWKTALLSSYQLPLMEGKLNIVFSEKIQD